MSMLSGWLDVPRHHSMSFRYLSVCSGIEAVRAVEGEG